VSVERLNLSVSSISAEAKDVLLIGLRAGDGQPLPAYTAGAHLELVLPNGLIRHYSLCGDPDDRQTYLIGVGLAADTRGGSRLLHGAIKVGDRLRAAAPRNNFAMSADAASHHFIAGGIGITPIMAMIRHCEKTGQPWTLDYLVRSRQRAAFLEDLAPFGDRVVVHSSADLGRRGEIAAMVARAGDAGTLYCCGPAALMEAVEQATSGFAPDRVRFEWFSAKETADHGPGDGFTVILAKSGRTIAVPAGRTLLEALEDAGIDAPYACREGICGSCEVAVLEGIPDHRDQVLTAAEQASNQTIITCCSRARSAELVLDL
jgi:ferredoxin-NADP reductase